MGDTALAELERGAENIDLPLVVNAYAKSFQLIEPWLAAE